MVESHRHYDLILEKIAQSFSDSHQKQTETDSSATPQQAEKLVSMIKVLAAKELK